MVYGRYNYIVNGDYFMVYKPTNITGGPHPVITTIDNQHFVVLLKTIGQRRLPPACRSSGFEGQAEPREKWWFLVVSGAALAQHC